MFLDWLFRLETAWSQKKEGAENLTKKLTANETALKEFKQW
jgi:hypothetical protein